jgi:23S rRNA pseudouridine1911/1915/1917 synthase
MDIDSSEFPVSSESHGQRLDLFLTGHLDIARNQVQKLIREGRAEVNGEMAGVGDKMRRGDVVKVSLPPLEKSNVTAEALPLAILYEDSWMVIINKARGIAVHPGGGRRSGTLVNALLYHIHDLSGVGGVERPGIVHRLDRDTSGVMVVAKHDRAHERISAQFNARKIVKEYIALVHGHPRHERGSIEAPLGRNPVQRKKMMILPKGRYARTEYEVLEGFRGFCLVKLKPLTGRTHQIRVHLTSLGHPLAGDETYGPRKCPFELKGQFLHARLLGLYHPDDGRYMEFTAPLPQELEMILTMLRKEKESTTLG